MRNQRKWKLNINGLAEHQMLRMVSNIQGMDPMLEKSTRSWYANNGIVWVLHYNNGKVMHAFVSGGIVISTINHHLNWSHFPYSSFHQGNDLHQNKFGVINITYRIIYILYREICRYFSNIDPDNDLQFNSNDSYYYSAGGLRFRAFNCIML